MPRPMLENIETEITGPLSKKERRNEIERQRAHKKKHGSEASVKTKRERDAGKLANLRFPLPQKQPGELEATYTKRKRKAYNLRYRFKAQLLEMYSNDIPSELFDTIGNEQATSEDEQKERLALEEEIDEEVIETNTVLLPQQVTFEK